MISKIWNGVRRVIDRATDVVLEVVKSPAARLVAVAVFVGYVLNSGVVLAQSGGGAQTIAYDPLINFGSIFDSIREPIGALVAGAIGLGLAIFLARYLFSVLKSMAR